MSKVTQISINFHKVVINAANYGMTQKNFHQFMGSKFNDIQPWIDKALKFISGIKTHGSLENYDFGEYEEDIFETIKLFKRMNPESFDVSFCHLHVSQIGLGTGIFSLL